MGFQTRLTDRDGALFIVGHEIRINQIWRFVYWRETRRGQSSQ
jgi:hypothetical protein